MKFSEFLREQKTFNLEKFKSDCAFVLDELKGTRGQRLMYRGVYDLPKDFEIVTWTERKSPRDSVKILHDQMNEFLSRKVGAPIRNWTFVTGRKQDAAIYSQKSGEVAVIFPIGPFEWVTTTNDDGHDLTGFYDRCLAAVKENPALKDKEYGEKQQIAIDMMKHKMDKWEWIKNEELAKTIKTGNEIMIKCDRFYVFNFHGETAGSDEFNDFLESI